MGISHSIMVAISYNSPSEYTVEVRNRFKGLNLIDRLPDELWNEVCDIVQETGIKTIPMEKKSKSKMAVWGGLTNSCEKKRSKKERYKHLNAEFQIIARRDKKAFFSDQCKDIEENNRMRKTRDLYEKIRYQGNSSRKDGHNKGQKWYGPNRSRRY